MIDERLNNSIVYYNSLCNHLAKIRTAIRSTGGADPALMHAYQPELEATMLRMERTFEFIMSIKWQGKLPARQRVSLKIFETD